VQLAIDTSTDTASLAIAKDGEVLAELTWCCGQNHSVELMPRLNRLLEQSRLGLQSISSIIVARGPGSLNGLRVGISTAKGLAFSLGVPIVGIGTLEAAAYGHAETGLPVCPILNAGRGEIATAIYQQKDGKWQQIIAEHITTADDLCLEIDTRTIFCGELTQATADKLSEKLGQKAIIPTPASRLRRAGFLAELGFKRLQAGKYDHPASLQPIYLRRPQITQPRHKTRMIDWKASTKVE
jgi:tRNA threonylcarbamoyl adenosine modification protein YeaZ